MNFKKQAQAWFNFILNDIKFLIYVKGVLINTFIFNFSQQRDENTLNTKLIDIVDDCFANKDTILYKEEESSAYFDEQEQELQSIYEG